MKYFCTFLALVFISFPVFSQSNSVELKDADGIVISSHNSIQAAYNAIPLTLANAYLIEILSAYNNTEEAFPIVFSNRAGSSETNTVTIRPAAGVTGKIISGTVSGTGGVAIILFNNCQYVILDGRPGGIGSAADLMIRNLSTTGTAYTLKLTNSASYNIVQYLNTFNATGNTAGGRNIAIEATPSGANSYNLITNCVIDGGRSGIGLIATGTGPVPNDNNTILNCIIKNFGYAGIWYLGASSNTTVSGCTFYQETSSSSTIMSALSFAVVASQGLNIIEKCNIYNIRSTATSSGFNPKGITGGAAAGSTMRIINNFISLPLNNAAAATVYGIHLTGSNDYNADILYNTIYIGGVHTGGTTGSVLSAGIVKANTGLGRYTQKNNICVNKRTGGISTGFHTGSSVESDAIVGILDIDYNTYNSRGSDMSFNAGWNNIFYNDLSDYKTAATPYEQNSSFHEAIFVSTTDLHLAGASVGDVLLGGTPIAGIADDIDNQTRSLTLPYKGADEGDIPLGSATTFQLSVDITNGWNMVSIPGLHPINQDVLTWWPGKDPQAAMFGYAGGYNPVTALTPGQGYWLKNAGANIYNTGDEWPAGGINTIPNDPLNGASGWNMVGGYHNIVSTSAITTNPPNAISAAIFGYANGYQQVTQLVPGYGYWLKLNQAAQIILPSGSTNVSKSVVKISDDWGRIVLTDNSGRHYTLYAADGETSLDNFELPPAPPTGMMDVRFESQRYAENLTEGFQTINFSGMEYPVTVRVENISIRLQDETGKSVNTILKPGEEISISRSEINKLMVSSDIIPDEYSLGQNYPNPFNPSTVIEFAIPEDASNVTLTIYDGLGQRVAELVNGNLQAGYYKYQWNAGKVASGIYIYQLKNRKLCINKENDVNEVIIFFKVLMAMFINTLYLFCSYSFLISTFCLYISYKK
jgi:hypothetical protein